MQFNKSVQRYCRFINREATIQVRELQGCNTGRSVIARQKYACRTAREGNMLTCRNARCKYINGGRGEDPFLFSNKTR